MMTRTRTTMIDTEIDWGAVLTIWCYGLSAVCVGLWIGRLLRRRM
jgi:hypothetical protein